MDILEKKEYYSILFDFYGCLFTEKQIKYFTEYYFYDNSLSEIATSYGISRAAVHDILNKMHDALESYEEKLKLYEKYLKRNELYDELLKDIDIVKKEKLIEKLIEIE